jgi:hypothetical protein
MGTLGGFPNPPALWLRRAKPAYANAVRWEPWEGSPFRVFDSATRRLPAWRVLSLQDPSPELPPGDSIRKVVQASIWECACSTGGTRPP